MKKYCLIKNGIIIEGPTSLPENTENVSNFYLLSDQELKSYGWLPYRTIDNIQENQNIVENQILVQSVIDILDDEVVETKIYRNMTQTEIDNRDLMILNRKWKNVRTKRNRLLLDSDWTQLNDSPVDKILWSTYRNQLRDLPQNFSHPDLVVWPTPPTN